MSLKTVHEHPLRRIERISQQPLPPALRKAFASNLSDKHQTALLEWTEDVVRIARALGTHDAEHPLYDPDPFDW